MLLLPAGNTSHGSKDIWKQQEHETRSCGSFYLLLANIMLDYTRICLPNNYIHIVPIRGLWKGGQSKFTRRRWKPKSFLKPLKQAPQKPKIPKKQTKNELPTSLARSTSGCFFFSPEVRTKPGNPLVQNKKYQRLLLSTTGATRRASETSLSSSQVEGPSQFKGPKWPPCTSAAFSGSRLWRTVEAPAVPWN